MQAKTGESSSWSIRPANGGGRLATSHRIMHIDLFGGSGGGPALPLPACPAGPLRDGARPSPSTFAISGRQGRRLLQRPKQFRGSDRCNDPDVSAETSPHDSQGRENDWGGSVSPYTGLWTSAPARSSVLLPRQRYACRKTEHTKPRVLASLPVDPRAAGLPKGDGKRVTNLSVIVFV